MIFHKTIHINMPIFSDLYRVLTARFYQPTPEETARYEQLADAGYIAKMAQGKSIGYEIRPTGRKLVYNRIYQHEH